MVASHIYQGATISNGTGDATVELVYVLMNPDGGKPYPLKITSGLNGWGFSDDVVAVVVEEVIASTVTVSAPQISHIFVEDLIATTATIVTGGHNDSVYLANVDTSGNLTVKTGVGDDTVTVTKHCSPHGAFTLDTGAGNDTVGLDSEAHDHVSDYFGAVKVILGAGDDHLTIGNSGVDGNSGRYWKTAVFDGGTGTNSIDYAGHGNYFSIQPVIVNFE